MAQGFCIIGDNSVEIQDFGPHRIWTLSAIIPPNKDNTEIALLNGSFADYLDICCNAIPTVQFYPYEMQIFSLGERTTLYVAIFN